MILKSDLEMYDCIGYGSFSEVYDCAYNENDYAYKQYTNNECVKYIKEKMLKLKKYKDKKIVFPVDFVYLTKHNKFFEGILFDYDPEFENMDWYDSIYYFQKKELLSVVRDLIEYFHKEYKMIHADIHPGNILYKLETKEAKLIDLDSSIDINNKSSYQKKISNSLTNNYIKYFGIDYDLDLYLFNLLSICFLKNLEIFGIDKKINQENIRFNSKKANKIIDSYKNLSSSKTLKKEYIIDYL